MLGLIDGAEKRLRWERRGEERKKKALSD